MDLKDIFKIIRKYLLIILACEILVVTASIFLIWRRPSSFMAIAKVQVKTAGKIYGGIDQYPILAEMSALEGYRNVQTQVEVIKSSQLRDMTMNKLRLNEKNSHGMSYKVLPEQDSDVITITVTSSSPEVSLKYANELPRQFLAYSLDQQRKEAQNQANFYESKKQEVQSQLDDAMADLEVYKTTHGIEDLQAETKNMIDTASTFRKMLDDASVELQSTSRKLDETEKANKEIFAQPDTYTKEVYVSNPLRSDLEMKKKTLEIDCNKARDKYGPNYPDVKAICNQLDDVASALQRYETLIDDQKRLETERVKAVQDCGENCPSSVAARNRIAGNKDKLEKEIYKDMIVGQRYTEKNQPRVDLLAKVAAMRADKEALGSKVAALKELVSQKDSPLGLLPEKEKNLDQLELKVLTLKEKLAILNKKYEDFRLSKEVPTDTGSIIETAERSYDVNQSRKLLSLIISILGGFFIGMVYAFIREYMDDTLYTTEDVEEALQLVVIGQIPLEKNLGKDVKICSDKPNTPVAESFRALRNRLKYILAEQDIRMFMVTSSSVREGKSFTALNLAITMALHGHKTLLVDADLRRSTVHKAFDVQNKGISNVVIDKQDVNDFIIETEIPNLAILPSGPMPLTETTPMISSEIFESRRVVDMFNMLSISFDYVIVDTPPIMAVTDVMALAAHVKALLFVVSAGEMQRSEVVKAKRLIESTGVKILGAVLNRTRHSVSYYRYLYYYYDKDTGAKKKRKAKY